jgi:SAM-dependent methyltransferase
VGLNTNIIRLLFEAKASGVAFDRTLTIGRQFLSSHPIVFADLAAMFGYPREAPQWLDTAAQAFAEPFFSLLGAKEVASMDYSDYEGATFVHDLNQPIHSTMRGRFDVVIDGGTLEHVFDFPTAIKNCMDLVKVDGRFLIFTPANNYCGHGFYQFSPELFFRLFSQENGFAVERAVIWEEKPDPLFYAVIDPAKAGERIEVSNEHPTLMMVQARKYRDVERLVTPLQSDYSNLWEATSTARGSRKRGLLRAARQEILRFVFQRFPYASKPLLKLQHWIFLRRHSFQRRRGFKPLGKLFEARRQVRDC